MKRVAIIDGDSAYRTLFQNMGFTVVLAIEDADLICFTGGEDVTPSLYGAQQHPTTYSSLFRDERERMAFEIAKDRNIPMVGICRGGQFLNVMCGGTMYQDVGDHTRAHKLTDLTSGEVIHVTSTHHQMMKPAKNAIILATANQKSYREWWEGGGFAYEAESDVDYEVLFYEKNKCLCFQPHPEMCQSNKDFDGMRKLFASYVEELLLPVSA